MGSKIKLRIDVVPDSFFDTYRAVLVQPSEHGDDRVILAESKTESMALFKAETVLHRLSQTASRRHVTAHDRERRRKVRGGAA